MATERCKSCGQALRLHRRNPYGMGCVVETEECQRINRLGVAHEDRIAKRIFIGSSLGLSAAMLLYWLYWLACFALERCHG